MTSFLPRVSIPAACRQPALAKSKPLIDQDTEWARAVNRRVEFQVKSANLRDRTLSFLSPASYSAGLFFRSRTVDEAQRGPWSTHPTTAISRKPNRKAIAPAPPINLSNCNSAFALLDPGDAVVDLGAAPGGWLQVAAKIVGQNGKVIGVDLQAIQPFRDTIFFFQGDIADRRSQTQIKELLGEPRDCVLSDLAPKLSGIRDADMARSWPQSDWRSMSRSKYCDPAAYC